MSVEFIVEQNATGKIGKFIGLGGAFYDIWTADGGYLGTSGTLSEARQMLLDYSKTGPVVKSA